MDRMPAGRVAIDRCQGIVPRFGALFIDTVILAFPAAALYLHTRFFSWYTVTALMLVYFTVFEAWVGKTPGKQFFGLRVVREDGDACGPAAAAIRNILRLIDQLVLYLVGAALIWSSPRHQRLGDRTAGTVVIKE